MAPPLPFVQAQGSGAVSADQLNTFVQTVLNYAQLRTFVGLTNMVVQVQGAVSVGDGGQGLYWYNAASTAADNNSSVIVPTGNVGNGAWLLIPSSVNTNLTISGTLTVDGATTLESTLGVDGVATFASDIVMSGTGELQLPAGTSAQRSLTPALGDIRYNTTLGYLETFGSGGWAPVAASATSGIFSGNITGLLPSAIAGTSTTASLTVSIGKAVDSTGVNILNLSIAGSWAVANGNSINGYQGGSTLPNSTTIHFFLCSGGTGTGVFAAPTLTPTLPAGYGVYFRRIFSLVTTSAGALIPVTADEVGGGAMLGYLTTPTLDINANTSTTTARTLYSMNVPSGVKMQWEGIIAPATAAGAILVTSPDEPDTAVAGSGSVFFDIDFISTGVYVTTTTRRTTVTNISGQIGVRSTNTATALAGFTTGWTDFRRT